MKIIKASAEILPENKNIIKQLGSRIRVCYQSSPVKNELKFVQGIIKASHASALEMADIHVQITLSIQNMASTLLNIESDPYMQVGYRNAGQAIISGSVRAWRELSLTVPDLCPMIKSGVMASYPDLFFDQIKNPENLKSALSYLEKSFNFVCGTSLNPENKGGYFQAQRIAVKFTVNRAVSHELVRHRGTTSILQESQRYCSYNKNKFGGEVTFIDPTTAFPKFKDDVNYKRWVDTCTLAEGSYLTLLDDGLTPQAARTVLPNSCKTSVILYSTLKQWSHIFFLRTSEAAEPSMREVMIPLHKKFQKKFPGLFEELHRME